MSIDPVKIPQNVYIEDRIVGPLTLRQTLMMAAGGGFSYTLFAVINKAYGSVSLPVTILVWIPCAISVIFALVKINDLSLMKICLLMLERLQKPTVRTFAPRTGIQIHFRTMTAKSTEELEAKKKQVEEAKKTEQRIKELSSILDSGTEEMSLARPTIGTEVKQRNDTRTEDEFETHPHAKENEENAVDDESEPLPRRPVDPERITVDESDDVSQGNADLSIFRDIFPKNS